LTVDEPQNFKRYPAIKTRIRDLEIGKYIESEKSISTVYGLIHKVKIVANVIVKRVKNKTQDDLNDSIIKNSDPAQEYYNFLVDDGSGSLWINTTLLNKDDFNKITIGQLVLIVGNIKKTENSLILYPDLLISCNDPNLEVLNELELINYIKINGISSINKQEVKSDEIDLNDSDVDSFLSNVEKTKLISEYVQDDFDQLDNRSDDIMEDQFEDKILGVISNNDSGDGVSFKKITQEIQLKEPLVKDILKKLSLNTKIYSNKSGYYKLYS
jgi:hypothetical protein